MKSYHITIKLVLFIVLSVAILHQVNAQDSKKDKDAAKIVLTKNMLDSQNFVFVPQTMIPMKGGSRTLTSDYKLAVSKDSLVSYLPFIGRAYTAPLLPGENGFDFTSTNFDYKIKVDKKNSWRITIKPKDQANVQQFALRVFDNGSASLNVTSLNREPISYSGYLTTGK